MITKSAEILSKIAEDPVTWQDIRNTGYAASLPLMAAGLMANMRPAKYRVGGLANLGDKLHAAGLLSFAGGTAAMIPVGLKRMLSKTRDMVQGDEKAIMEK